MPIAISKREWARILKWTQLDSEDPDVVRKREYFKFVDEASRKMTKSWPNSVENVNKRNEELRQARIDAAEQANTKFYKRYLKRKKEEQERLMYSARDAVFKNRDAPKLLLSAVIECAVQKERSEQVKFRNERRKEEIEKKRKDDDEIIRKAKEWEALQETKKKRRFEVNKQHQKDIVEQAHELSERNRIEHELELGRQKVDNMKANEELEAIKEFDQQFKKEEKARIFLDMSESRKEHAQVQRERAARDALDDKLIQVLLNSRCRIEKRRKETELEMKAEKARVLENISHKLESGDAARDNKEQEILEKAKRLKEQAEEEARQARLRKVEEFRRDKQQSREQFLKDEEQRLHEMHTLRQWDMMNRFKNQEIYEDFKDNQRKEKQRNILEYREELLRLWKERTDREAAELAERRYFYGELAEKKLRHEDNKLLTHAAALLEEVKQLGRPEFPLRRAVDQYCCKYRLYPMPDVPATTKLHFPHYTPGDYSRPQPDYRESPRPPPDSGSDDDGNKDGLQAIDKVKAGPSKPKKKEVKPEEDYKRAGPANGMQRKNLDTTLPKITVIPCKNEACRCELKP